MSEGRVQKQELLDRVKCIKCGQRNATNDDQMCDSCRFMFTLESINKRK